MKRDTLTSMVVTDHYKFDSYAEREEWCSANMNKSPWVLGHNHDLFIERELENTDIITVTKFGHAKGNDLNGNPRRLYVIQRITVNGSERIDVIEENHNGNGAWNQKYPTAITLGDYELPASLYNVYKKMVVKQ